ncbi:acyltransferase [Olleya sp. ITB9]|uniref:acyltransferase family protein n=1 Tax=Olleya sp. ITB9 TaxID=1715648 RepID=UPI0009E88462|nr:acyltransferase [Olleya sp. ITB9]
MKRLPNLDVLRFVLVSIVVFFHLPQLCKNQGLPYFIDAPIFNRGIEAVYLFFVLSGFLIIKIIYDNKQEGTFSIKKFYTRRVLRIFPLYYLIMIFGYIFYWLVLPKLGMAYHNNYALTDSIVLTTFFMPNISAKLFMPGGILEVLWSIGIEEQFYILVAPLLFFVNKNRVLQLLIVLTIGYFIVFHLDIFSYFKKYNMVFFFMFFGGIVAILEDKKKLEFLKYTALIPITIFTLTVLYFTTTALHVIEGVWFNLVSMVLFGLFVHTLAYNNRGIQIKNKALNYLGQISYGLYMYNVIALYVVVYLFLELQKTIKINAVLIILLMYLLTFALTVIIAHFSYKYFEGYFLKLKNKFR